MKGEWRFPQNESQGLFVIIETVEGLGTYNSSQWLLINIYMI